MKIGAEGQIFPPCEGVRNFSPPCEGARNVSPPCEGGVGGVWGWLARAMLPGHQNPPVSPLRKGGREFRRRSAQQLQDEFQIPDSGSFDNQNHTGISNRWD